MSSASVSLPSWLGRAIVEGALIVFAVVLGFVVNEWREDVADRHAARQAMARVAAEIQGNIDQLEAVVAYHESATGRIDERIAEIESAELPVQGVIFDEFPRILPRGVNAPGLTRFAWDHAQEHGRLDVLPYEIVAETARLYDMQEAGVESTWRQIVELLFAGPSVMEPHDLVPSLRFTRIGFTELAAQERFLIGQYQRLLEKLEAAGLAAPADEG
ncbi:hypothetical protein [Maricaulis parjimensis]|uniref:hypothetical protein n=1 Tax=Maricaulis parjimensis TaxID=144023 RepID=UPI00193A3CAF|nr:hypothetical protein [Maricaulis parjimensis]